MARILQHGIKFPISIKSERNTLLDMNYSEGNDITSQIQHLLYTPKGQRIRKPEFGTSLIQYIFNPNDNQTWEDVESEIKQAVNENIPNCVLKNIEIAQGEDEESLYSKITYSVNENGKINTYSTITKL